MTEKHDDTDVAEEPDTDRIDETPEGVLSPSDLDFDGEVTPLEENRFVVAPDGDIDPSEASSSPSERRQGDTESVPLPSGAYAAAVTMRTPEGTRTTQVSTNDVRELFDELLLWYVEGMAPEADPEEALSVLLSESSLNFE